MDSVIILIVIYQSSITFTTLNENMNLEAKAELLVTLLSITLMWNDWHSQMLLLRVQIASANLRN